MCEGTIVCRSLIYSYSEASGKNKTRVNGITYYLYLCHIPIVENLENTEKLRKENKEVQMLIVGVFYPSNLVFYYLHICTLLKS